MVKRLSSRKLVDSLFDACKIGDLEGVQKLLGPSPSHDTTSILDPERRSLLTTSIENKHVSVVELLINHGITVPEEALVAAASSGIADIMHCIISSCPNPAPKVLQEALDLASSNGYVDVVTLLLDFKTLLDLRRSLECACEKGHHLVVTELLRSGAAMRGPRSICSCLHLAASRGHSDIVDSLLGAGAIVDPDSIDLLFDAAEGGVLSLLHIILTAGHHDCQTLSRALGKAFAHPEAVELLLDARADPGAFYGINTPLMLALGEGNVESARVLLAAEKDADVNRRSRAGCSLLALAAKGGCVELMQPLIRAKADVNAQDRQKYSVLSHAWQPAAVKLLVDAKADLNPRHSCVLRSACRRLEPEAVRMLLVAGARVNGPHPCTSLYNAIGALPEPGREHDKAQVVRALLEAKATLIPAAGQSLLHYCAYLDSAGGMAEVIRVLLAREPSQRDGRDDEHRTPLMLAAQTLHEDAVVELARAGADPNAVDAAGVSVLAHAVHACDAARQYGPAHKVLRALIAAGADPLACDAAGLSVPMRMLEADLGRVDVDREDDDVLDVVLQLFVELAAENLGLDPV